MFIGSNDGHVYILSFDVKELVITFELLGVMQVNSSSK